MKIIKYQLMTEIVHDIIIPIERIDENGAPVYEEVPILDDYGQPMLDEEGNLIVENKVIIDYETKQEIEQILNNCEIKTSEEAFEVNYALAVKEAYNGEVIVENVEDNRPLDAIKADKEQEISLACNQAIIVGMDVETSKGLEHFSLQETDQINLTTATNAIQQGLTEYPYHADGQLCRMFTAEEILSIANAATKHKLYHTTLCNHLLTWIRRAETKEELDSIIYSEEVLPEDLAANMVYILSLSSL